MQTSDQLFYKSKHWYCHSSGHEHERKLHVAKNKRSQLWGQQLWVPELGSMAKWENGVHQPSLLEVEMVWCHTEPAAMNGSKQPFSKWKEERLHTDAIHCDTLCTNMRYPKIEDCALKFLLPEFSQPGPIANFQGGFNAMVTIHCTHAELQKKKIVAMAGC